MGTSMFLNRVNTYGIPCIQSRSTTQSSTTVTFNFDSFPYVSSMFSGLIAVRIAESAGTGADALPVYFNVPSIAGTNIALTTFGGTPVTGVEMTEGIHLVFYDRFNSVLQLLV